MDDYPESAMIALLPNSSEWCKIKFPHLTLVYAGEIADLNPTAFNEMAKDACSLAMMNNPFSVKVTGVEVFGQDMEKVDVLTLENTMLLDSMRHFVQDWDASEYDEFKPHCTIGPEGSYRPQGYSSPNVDHQDKPSYLTFDRICVSWGKQIIPFWLKQCY